MVSYSRIYRTDINANDFLILMTSDRSRNRAVKCSMARKFVGMTRIVSRQSVGSVFSSRVASPRTTCRESKGESTCSKDSSLRRRQVMTRGGVLRFHHYAIEDGRYHPPRGSCASVAAPGIFSSWPTRPTSIDTEQMSCESRRSFSSSSYVPCIASPYVRRKASGKSDRKYSTRFY